MIRISFIGLLLPLLTFGQVTLKITSIPSNTPKSEKIYLVGNINDWDPKSEEHVLKSDAKGNLIVEIEEGLVPLEFKFTRGSWVTSEGNVSGDFLPNRVIEFTGKPQMIEVKIDTWEDLSGRSKSTISNNVSILRASFYIPQLNRFRKIWIYLPPDYEKTTKKYPVIYAQDGQNMFDNTLSFSGEWEVDETLNELHRNGDYGAIVVAIRNGDVERINEYSPWKNPNYGGGDGDLYMQFLAETLKPFIDSNYRTLTDPRHNVLVGSSMGGLISTYGTCKYPTVFGKAIVLSPAYWIALNSMNDFIETSPQSFSNLKLYIAAGESESTTMVPHIDTIKSKLVKKGVSKSNISVNIDKEGSHTEKYWKQEFKKAYLWLFQNDSVTSKK